MSLKQRALDGLWTVPMRDLGLARVLWGGQPDGAWQFSKLVVPPTLRVLAPGSAGYGMEHMPLKGGVVLAMNHLAAIDPPLVGQYFLRPVYFMAKAELMAVPFLGKLLSDCGVFSVRRGESDRDAIRHARDMAAQGRVVGLFAEGTRQKSGRPGPVQPGAAMIAMQEGVPVLPCGLDSFGHSLSNRRACSLVFGEPFWLDDLPCNGRGYKAGSERIGEELERLWAKACEATAAGRPPVFEGMQRYRPGWREPFDAALLRPEELARRIAAQAAAGGPPEPRRFGPSLAADAGE